MPSCPRDQPPFGFAIQHSNTSSDPCWLVMLWGQVLRVCPTLHAASLYLMAELECRGWRE